MPHKLTEEENEEIWKPDESDVVETFNVFKKQIDSLVDNINTYWYAGKAKKPKQNNPPCSIDACD